MNKKMFCAMAMAAGLMTTVSAQAKDMTGWFINGSAGHAHYNANAQGLSGSESGSAYIVNVGYRVQFIGVELGYTDLGSVKGQYTYGGSPYSYGYTEHAKLSADGETLGLNGHFNFTRNVFMSARIGGFQWKLNARTDIDSQGPGSGHYADSQEALNWYGGVGLGWDIDRHWSVSGNFDYYYIKHHSDYKIDTKIYSATLEYRF
ncbi:outer membrane beta-barrel protein [Oleiagrimonas sp. C23AA]|uniref:outer membrane beta-barrel protein n=1 Tax=Oleiagrimonas sp. C23AA TaxID=2719047 RepID=UPI0014209BEE|nr:outer membrane beta-barrel protein [Oleiagrimonas sp. C23AA]NII12365.1 outer membrane beta-barrel protein [Oleiagrimonas sp. C23AA]